MTALGGFILFFGFFAFNGGSEATISVPGAGENIARAVVNTILSASAAGLTCLVTCYFRLLTMNEAPTLSLATTINGGLAGMVRAWPGGHDDVMAWKRVPHYGPFVRESTGEFPSQRPVVWGFGVFFVVSLQWRHNGHDGVSNQQPHQCLLNRLFGRRSKKTSKLRVTGLCVGNSPLTGEFPAQMASNAENVSIWWRHHVEQAVVVDVFAVNMLIST